MKFDKGGSRGAGKTRGPSWELFQTGGREEEVSRLTWRGTVAVNDDQLEAQELEELGASSMDMKIVRNTTTTNQLLPPTFFLWLRLTCADHDVSQVFAENLARTEVSFKYSFRVAALPCPL